MIIFYIKKTHEIVGTVSGRVHAEDVLKNSMIIPGGYKKDEIGKYVVPFKANFETIEEPVIQHRVINKKTMEVGEVVVGKKLVKRSLDMTPDVTFADLITNFEKGKDKIFDYQIELDKNNKVSGLKKKTNLK